MIPWIQIEKQPKNPVYMFYLLNTSLAIFMAKVAAQ